MRALWSPRWQQLRIALITRTFHSPHVTATYAYHLTQAHAFLDGNKRTAAAVSEIFLELNGAHLNATNDEIVATFLRIAAGDFSREEAESFFLQKVLKD